MNDQQPPKLPDSFQAAEQFQRLFVTPMIEMVKTEMNNHVAEIKSIAGDAIGQVKAMDARVTKLEGSQKRALLGWGVYATAIGIACTAAWKWITSKIHIN